MTLKQKFYREKFRSHSESWKLRRMSSAMWEAKASADIARAELEKRRACTVYLGVERDVYGPQQYSLRVSIWPEFARYAAARGPMSDDTFMARQIAHEVAVKAQNIILRTMRGEPPLP